MFSQITHVVFEFTCFNLQKMIVCYIKSPLRCQKSVFYIWNSHPLLKLLPPQSPGRFSALARLYYLARPTKTAMLRRLPLSKILTIIRFTINSFFYKHTEIRRPLLPSVMDNTQIHQYHLGAGFKPI